MNIGIVVLATNSYFILGVRFIKKFMYHYKGSATITFYFFSEVDPAPYLPDNINVEYRYMTNGSWTEGTNSKFKSILSLEHSKSDYLFYFDADTNVQSEFTEEWFLGDMVGGQHFGDEGFMKENKAYDRNPNSQAYVPLDTPLTQHYYYGAFFGGKKDNMIQFCKKLKMYQELDQMINYEPAVNDESYINKEFHYNPPTKMVLCGDFKFAISDKGGIGDTRDMKLDIEAHKAEILKHKNQLFEIWNNTINVV